ncbi:MAG: PadR family transcriptional regulator [Actinomycetota bacterium]
MREPTYFLLLALAEETQHGYAAAKRAEALSDGRIRITAGTLYGALDRLVEAGTIAVDREETVKGRKRRYYRLTDDGRLELATEVARLQAAAAAASHLDLPAAATEAGLA